MEILKMSRQLQISTLNEESLTPKDLFTLMSSQ